MNLLDCTIRDGGYINNWDFTFEEVIECYKAVSLSGFDYFEIGFRTNKNNSGKGRWFYSEEKDINLVKKSIKNGCKISVMTRIEKNNIDIESFIECKNSCIDMVRVFLSYENEDGANNLSGISEEKLEECYKILKILKNLDYEVCLNLGCSYNLKEDDYINIFKKFEDINIDYIYFADSYGCMIEQDIKNIISKIKKYKKKGSKIGFHAHNNLSNAYSNARTAINNDIDILDSCISGLGRGSGNLTSEIISLYCNSKNYSIKPLLNYSDKYIMNIHKYYGKFNFGYNNLLMITGFFNIHPNYANELIHRKPTFNSEKCFDILMEIKKIGQKNKSFNYDKNLISKITSIEKTKIKIIFTDFDGTLTDGKFYTDSDGNNIRSTSVKDAYIIKKFSQKIDFIILSGSDMNFFKKRAEKLNINKICDNIDIKESKFNIIKNILREKNLNINECCFIGDDLNDKEALKNCFSSCPEDSNDEIKKYCNYISKQKGGEGCLRDFVDYLENLNLL